MGKSGSAKAMTKGELLKSIVTEHDMKTKDCSNILNSLVTVAAKEVKKTGVFTIPGLCRIKTRSKPATRACTKIFRQGDQGEGKASKDSCESFSSCCPKAADLSSVQSIALLSTISMAQACLWESHSVYMLESL